MPLLGNAHNAKSKQADTVLIAEESYMMLTHILEGDDEFQASDEKNMPYILVSRARDRVVYLLDMFHQFGAQGIEALFRPDVYTRLLQRRRR
mmetsp:Transcript_4634/g.13642  ORF Transcript_4634/g.13642 Transcript_4634/m.13642 type:complete len:92 (+) Transcript_4634:2007-2282(+)